MTYAFTALLWISVAVLLWRTITSKQHWAVRLGGAAAAMLTFVGSITARGASGFRIEGIREWIAIALCAAAPAYLFLWSRSRRGRKRPRTASLIAALIGFVPIVASILFTIVSVE
jgi:hypothetical protein